MAPQANDNSGWSTTRSGSKKFMLPKPSQVGQAPTGLLKRKQARLQLGQAVSAHRAGERGGKPMLFAAVHFHRQRAVVRRGAARFQSFRPGAAACHRALSRGRSPRRYVCLMFFSSLGTSSSSIHFAVYAHARKALRLQIGEQIGKFAFASAHGGGEDHHARVFAAASTRHPPSATRFGWSSGKSWSGQ